MDQRVAIGIFGDKVATDLLQVTHDPKDLDLGGWWAVTQTFEGSFTAFKFGTISPVKDFDFGFREFNPVNLASWRPSMDQNEYENAVKSIQDDISKGWVYQVNLCYVLSNELEKAFDPIALYFELKKHNPAPYLSALYVPKHQSGLSDDVAITSASPELFISRKFNEIKSSPIKGTAITEGQLLEKDRAENVMIVDLIRNDLSRVAIDGSVNVPELLRVEPHPGLVHLVSDVRGTVDSQVSWQQILDAMSPPGSVSGAPKSSALEVISRLEPVPRQIYCGAFGFIDVNNNEAVLAVGIRTFWQTTSHGKKYLNFGTGAGITWGSSPELEWQETQLKTRNLLKVAATNVE